MTLHDLLKLPENAKLFSEYYPVESLYAIYENWLRQQSLHKLTPIKSVAAFGEKFGPDLGFVVAFRDYDAQVGNGGHEQYFCNGYATGDGQGGMIFRDSNLPQHLKMITAMEKAGLHQLLLGKEIYQILKEFKVVQTENKFQNSKELNELDNRYYEIRYKWLEELEAEIIQRHQLEPFHPKKYVKK